MVRRLLLAFACLTVAAVATASPVFAGGGGFTLFGDATRVHPGNNSKTAIQIRSVGSGFGGVDFRVRADMTFGQVGKLGTDYNFTAASCGLGSPRFQINVSTGSGTKNAFVYIGPPPNYTNCAMNTWVSTGNLATPTSFVDTSQLGGTFYDTFAHADVAFGSLKVTGIQLVVDAGFQFGTQTVLIDNVMINNRTFTFERHGEDGNDQGEDNNDD